MMCVSFAKSARAICKSRNGESGNGIRGTMGRRGIRAETRGIRVGTRGIKVEIRGIGVAILGVGNSNCDSV